MYSCLPAYFWFSVKIYCWVFCTKYWINLHCVKMWTLCKSLLLCSCTTVCLLISAGNQSLPIHHHGTQAEATCEHGNNLFAWLCVDLFDRWQAASQFASRQSWLGERFFFFRHLTSLYIWYCSFTWPASSITPDTVVVMNTSTAKNIYLPVLQKISWIWT